jgi:hypothetical protein
MAMTSFDDWKLLSEMDDLNRKAFGAVAQQVVKGSDILGDKRNAIKVQGIMDFLKNTFKDAQINDVKSVLRLLLPRIKKEIIEVKAKTPMGTETAEVDIK